MKCPIITLYEQNSQGGVLLLKFFSNLLFVLIIFMLATALPLSTDILSLNFSEKIVDVPTDTVTPIDITYHLSSDEVGMLVDTVNIIFTASDGVADASALSDYTLVVSGNKGYQNTLSLDDLYLSAQYVENGRLHIAFSPASMLSSLPQDYYRFMVKPSDESEDVSFESGLSGDSEVLSFYATNYAFDEGISYLGTSNATRTGYTNMTVYYPNKDYTQLIPVTRQVVTPDNRWRSMYSLLFNGPASGLGLLEGVQIIPHSPNIQIVNKIAGIYLYADQVAEYEDRFPVVAAAISKSMLSMGYIDGVRFYIDNAGIGTFGGVDLETVYTRDSALTAYVGFQGAGSDVLMLAPIEYTAETQVGTDAIDTLWTVLTTLGDQGQQDSELIQLVPPTLSLLDYTLENGVLTVNFNDVFNHYYEASPILRTLFIDSLLYSFTSLPDVNTVQFNVDGQPAQAFDAYLFDTPLSPKAYLNFAP